MYKVLSLDENDRAGRYHFEIDRLRFVATRAFLRVLLGNYLKLPPGALAFTYGATGKPGLPGNPLHFSVSHSANRAMFAFSPAQPLGVDIELVHEISNPTEIAARFFSPAETEAISMLPYEERLNAFYRCWTRKEAFLKATGAGLSYGLNQFEVSLGKHTRLIRIGDSKWEADQWRLYHLDPEAGYVGTLATRQHGVQIIHQCFSATTYASIRKKS